MCSKSSGFLTTFDFLKDLLFLIVCMCEDMCVSYWCPQRPETLDPPGAWQWFPRYCIYSMHRGRRTYSVARAHQDESYSSILKVPSHASCSSVSPSPSPNSCSLFFLQVKSQLKMSRDQPQWPKGCYESQLFSSLCLHKSSSWLSDSNI